MHLKFTINLGFWEIFKKRNLNSASNIQPQYTEEVQTFSVDLYDPQIRKSDQLVDLQSFLETMGTDGQRMPTFEEREASQPMQNIMPGWQQCVSDDMYCYDNVDIYAYTHLVHTYYIFIY